ncbi:hypothetical protein PFLUV_G00176150 [Perca fluviatilis]|uniref:C2H2-type domain-containing protein n=1 Tax=Perca fluviatilis TaxID=8168 RepID=A0A6A5DWE3_PERFL|nr:hypothetical protein PFLUV_G00176150 [Perca fluviatilis]
MDTTLFQLRSFVHQRLYIAAEEILGEVEKTITLALYEAEVSQTKQEVGSLRHQLTKDLRKKSAAEPPMTNSTVERGDECDAPLLQENTGPSTPEKSNFSLGAEVPGPSQISADPDNNNWNYCLVQTDFKMLEIKEEQEELGDDSQTQEMVFPSPEIVKSEQDQPETELSYELQPVSSDCSAAQSENNDSDEELVTSKEEQTITMKRKGKMLHGQSGNVNEKAALPHDKSSAKSEKERGFCHFCGKGFQYIGSLMKHIKTHENNFDCTVCAMTCQSTEQLITHLKSFHNKTHFCDVCGKTFANIRRLRLHEKIHTGIKEFVCQECATESPLTGKEVLQETSTQSSIQEESNLSVAEVPVPSQTSADTDNDGNYCLVQTNFKMSEIKEEEEIGNDCETQDVIFPSPKGVKNEPETQVSYELQPVSSDCSAPQSESSGSDEDGVQSIGERTKMRRRKVKILLKQNGSAKKNGPAAWPDGDSSAKSQKERRVCSICGKGFQSIRPFMKHMKTHRRTSESTKELLRHLQSAYSKRLFC